MEACTWKWKVQKNGVKRKKNFIQTLMKKLNGVCMLLPAVRILVRTGIP